MASETKDAAPDTGAQRCLKDFAFPSPEVTACPYPFYAALRAEAPVYKYPDRNDYLISRRDDIMAVLRNTEVFSNRTYLGDPRMLQGSQKGWVENPPHTPGTAIQTSFGLTASDPPEHSIKRRALRSLVDPRYIRASEDTLRRIANELIDTFIHEGKCELRTQFADPLALLTICELAGYPPEDRAIFLGWNRIGTGHGRRYLTDEQRKAQDEDIPERDLYCAAIIRDRLANPKDDFITGVVKAQVERDGEINLPYLVSEIGLVLTAGNETTSRLVANVWKLLIENPSELKKVLDDRELIPNVIDEALRFEAPTQWTSRLVMQDTEVGGVPIPKGAYVLMLYGSANHDESWGDPEAFRVDRPGIPELNMAFGGGPHRCLGNAIAIAEGRIALAVMLDRLKNPRFAPGHDAERENIDNFQKRVPKQLHIEFDAQ